ncbi:hypothetical protein CTAYLR_007255 [Chrysophaeum taylorii]|uniref:RAP domain-containing protein n=1 Tax=Chrysophaeum taylorii TaxID=2483200 RepID=A0AAD7XHG4_9STRA|nr:hypothetical protein CTAYLR_007255 [Chrysophaeum taylorii]
MRVEAKSRRKAPELFEDDDHLRGDKVPGRSCLMPKKKKKKPEVMAPAGGWPQLRAAVNNGADAVYFGLSRFSARARAVNFGYEELSSAVGFCRENEVRAYVALNTIVFEEEMAEVAEAVRACEAAGVDAVIVQDLGLQRLVTSISSLPVHASTQQSITSAEGAEFARMRGANRVVVGRELSVEHIGRVVAGTSAEVEVFVHGALCVSVSGQCFSSEAWGGRSANRGQCAQACRLPYGLVVDGRPRDTLDGATYLLSPQDLCGLEHVPALVDAGVACLKIEGRLKDERYVAATTRAYRRAVDAYCDEKKALFAEEEEVSRRDLAQVFSRAQDEAHDGLDAGFLDGARHQALVRGLAPRHRGIFAGRVVAWGVDDKKSVWIDVVLRVEDLKKGDGVAVEKSSEEEVGGRLAKVSSSQTTKGGATRCWFQAPPHGPRAGATGPLWRTSDAAVDAKLRAMAAPAARDRVRRSAVNCSVDLGAGVLRLTDGDHVATATFPVVKAASANHSSAIRRAVGSLGDTPWRLDALEIDAQRGSARSADVKAARRRAVRDLARMRAVPPEAAPPPRSTAARTVVETKLSNSNNVGVSVLVRSLEQCEAAVSAAAYYREDPRFLIDEIVLDFLELKGLETALALVRRARLTAVVAAPRVLMPDERQVWRRLVALEPDALLVRSPGLLHALVDENISSIRGDFSLNAANALAFSVFSRAGLDRLAPTYDLSGDAVARLARAVDQSETYLEAIVHSHLPVFHSAHCVFARHLSDGNDYRDCGHPCERHAIHLRRDGQDHHVLADMGCRNTVFNAAAQSGAKDLEKWLDAGIKRYRIEFVSEPKLAVANIIDAYARLFRTRGQAPEPLWSLLSQVPDANGTPQGVHVGSFHNAPERPPGHVSTPPGRPSSSSKKATVPPSAANAAALLRRFGRDDVPRMKKAGQGRLAFNIKIDTELANTAWAFATAGVEASGLFDAIARTARSRVGEFKTQEFANIVWAFAKAGAKAPWVVDAIATTALLGEFNAQDLANTTWAIVTMGIRAPQTFDAIARAAMTRLADFNPQGLANMAWAFATAGVKAPRLFDAIAKTAEPRLGEFNAQGLSNTSWAFATAGVKAPGLFRAISDAARYRLGSFNSQDLSNTAWAFTTAGVKAPGLFEAIAKTARSRLRGFNAQDLANTSWAFAAAGVNARGLFDAIANCALSRLSEFNAQHIANTTWAFAKSGIKAHGLFDAIAKSSLVRLDEFSAQNIANTAWAFATAEVEARGFFNAIANTAQPRLIDFNSQNLTNTAWAFATAGVEAAGLFEAIARTALSRLGEFNSQGLANMVWAFAKAGVKAPALFDVIANTARLRLGEFNSQDLAETAWAFAALDVEAVGLFDAIAHTAQSRLGDFNSQDLANTAWAFATAGVEAPGLFEAIASKARSRLGKFNSQDLANTVWAFATAGIDARELFDAVANAARSRLGEFTSQNLANTAWAFATASVATAGIFDAIADTARPRLGEFNSQDLANTAWAFACSDWTKDPEFLSAIVSALMADPDALNNRQMSQLHLVSLHFDLEWPDRRFPFSRLRRRLQTAYQGQDPAPSLLQRDVAAALRRVGWAHVFEHVTSEGLSLDMAQPETKQAVEVDGPTHFLKRTSRESHQQRDLRGHSPRRVAPKGAARFKARLLRRLGWDVVHVPFFEWDTLVGAVEQGAYLEAKLQNAKRAPGGGL